VLEQEAAGHRAEGDGDARESGPDRDRPATLLGITEDVGEDRQRGRHDQRAADAHERTGEDQLIGGVDRGGGDRAKGEEDETRLQCTLAPEAVGHAAGGQQQSGEDDHIRVDDPLDLAVAGVEVTDQRRDGDVEDRVVDDDDQQADAQDAEDHPAPFVDMRIELVVPGSVDCGG
jgi:hypothetical protein